MIVSVAAADLPGWVNWVTSVATVIIALALVVAAFAFTGVAIAVRKMVPKVNGLVARMQEGALPVLKHGQDVAENVRAAVADAITRLVGLQVVEVNVDVNDVHLPDDGDADAESRVS